mmetsp:Transcript_6440/g.18520  ORF Transcript_6440/g.18520 Transcript_6440/m.18520 type:complete len:211 (+) Transcript_6440:1464-2096(+)
MPPCLRRRRGRTSAPLAGASSRPCPPLPLPPPQALDHLRQLGVGRRLLPKVRARRRRPRRQLAPPPPPFLRALPRHCREAARHRAAARGRVGAGAGRCRSGGHAPLLPRRRRPEQPRRGDRAPLLRQGLALQRRGGGGRPAEGGALADAEAHVGGHGLGRRGDKHDQPDHLGDVGLDPGPRRGERRRVQHAQRHHARARPRHLGELARLE